MTDLRPMTPLELRKLFGWCESTYHVHLAAGHLDQFELVPRIGARRFSRPLVHRYLSGEGFDASNPRAAQTAGARATSRTA
jgi:hypothetical protein